MDLGIKNKVFLVTGGASGIGLGIVKALLNDGAIPCIIDRKVYSGAHDDTEIMKPYDPPISICSELTDEESCKKAVRSIIKRTGRIDGLINNAGINDGVGLEGGSLGILQVT